MRRPHHQQPPPASTTISHGNTSGHVTGQHHSLECKHLRATSPAFSTNQYQVFCHHHPPPSIRGRSFATPDLGVHLTRAYRTQPQDQGNSRGTRQYFTL